MVRSASLRQETVDILDEGFQDVGGITAFDEDTLIEHADFEVNGKERVLDLSPSILFRADFETDCPEEYTEGLHAIDAKE